ncbi:recombinase family protein [Clostridium butyricum]|jgi:DNA invertase Pin-like site-specific DNA recombinase|uniref:recombinase family protein n=1 Tax=Clostridium butyricum TaxID=1492 RepID=UPI000F54A9FB|nr:recombinase family protein [Clostridium butyricum]RQN12476.1 recombinase family protein [Clostridium butyricum]
MVKKNVAVIPAKTIQEVRGLPIQARTRVCAYCRVSTDNEEQLSSYEAQVSHYTNYIQSKLEWDFAGIYADEGISGTNTKKRVEFNRMIEDCMAGKIDMVITKSVSRFARNTLDCLQYIRMLREKGIAVYFEKENINTLDAKGELLLVIMGSLAQEESRSLSTNTRWGIVHQFQEGKVRITHTKFLGYTKDENGDLKIVPKEAKIIERIYKEYLQGKSATRIAKDLEKDGIKTPTGRKRWWESTVTSILRNEKYMGDALLQKSLTVDFLTKKRVKNKGHAQQYYVEDSHPAIISKEMFQQVQEELKRRSSLRKKPTELKTRFTSEYPFSGITYCGKCGMKFRRKRWGTKKYAQDMWMCMTRVDKGVEACDMPAAHEEKLKQAFVRAINKAINDKEAFVKKIVENVEKVVPPIEEDLSIEEIEARLKELQQELMSLVRLNVNTGFDAEVYDGEYGRIAKEIESLREKKQRIQEAKLDDTIRKNRAEQIAEIIKEQDLVKGFDEELFREVIDRVTVLSIVEVEFQFKSGLNVKEIL